MIKWIKVTQPGAELSVFSWLLSNIGGFVGRYDLLMRGEGWWMSVVDENFSRDFAGELGLFVAFDDVVSDRVMVEFLIRFG